MFLECTIVLESTNLDDGGGTNARTGNAPIAST